MLAQPLILLEDCELGKLSASLPSQNTMEYWYDDSQHQQKINYGKG